MKARAVGLESEDYLGDPEPYFISQRNPQPAGYSSEFCGLGQLTAADALGVEIFAHRLGELVAARDTRLPLAIGLFGNWGSGKSHFMNLMDHHIQALSANERTRLPATPGPWCHEIVPIYFNAWHYVDANLWASLVTEIFESLFRHVSRKAGSPDQQKARASQLMAELQKANGVVTGAEESWENAKLEKAAAEKEERHAEEKAERATHRRDKLEGWIDGVLDNLEKLVPAAVMKPEWREAIQTLHLDEARKSYAVLADQVDEIKTLSGRIRLLGRSIFAPKGRKWRFGWLAAAVLIAPLATGCVTWYLTAWNVELRKVGTIIGELSGLLAGVGAWVAVQLERGRGLVAGIEDFAREADKRRAAKEADPMLKRARQSLSKCAETEARARAQLEQARQQVQRLEEELRDLQPDRRLTRFIEERARADDYRSHLGLVSLVRRDFQELSRLFTEKRSAQSAGLPSGEANALTSSVDRIVLYIDDLDRCKADKVVDVLQAVHLLLAYPLFAVVVGVDQRCLKQSLESQFPGLVRQNVEAKTAGPATALDYLEKIFHIPFHLPPMGQRGFTQLLEGLAAIPPALNRDQSAETRGKTTHPPTASLIIADPLPAPREFPTHHENLIQATAPSPAPAADPETELDQNPLQQWELDALRNYHRLIETPRGVIRLLNTYRLVRAGIRDQHWATFRGNGKDEGEFCVVMLLLACAAGQPAFARGWFQLLRTREVDDWFALEPKFEPEGWGKFKESFSGMNNMPKGDVKAAFEKWLDQVERFAF